MDELNSAVKDFKKKLIDAVNGSGLPGVLLFEIVNNLAMQICMQIQEQDQKKGAGE